jgi:hypothetical protein
MALAGPPLALAGVPCINTMQLLHHWGFTEQAERWNGRLAMLGFVIGLITEGLTGQSVIAQVRMLWPWH